MNVLRFALHACTASALALPGLALASQALPAQEDVNIVPSIAPHVRPAAGQPCVVELLHERPFPQEDALQDIDRTVTYAPPTACPPPWAKVILKVDITSTRRSVVDTLNIDLGKITIFSGETPRYGGTNRERPSGSSTYRWYVERDMTDYSALFRQPRTGLLWAGERDEAMDDSTAAYTGNATLVFYPATAQTPAPRVPDGVYPISSTTPRSLPRNIVQAYVDIYNQMPRNSADPFHEREVPTWWYTCLPDEDGTRFPQLLNVYAPGDNPKEAIHNPVQGCGGGSFREFQVTVDGMPAGVAPAFPVLRADLNIYFTNSVNQPIPTIQMLLFTPYRVDLTPFAGVMDRPGLHQIGANGALLVYLDHGRSQVTGAVTSNTLNLHAGVPAVTDTLAKVNGVLRGRVTTTQQRDFEIRGYVDTSGGRVQSRVHQRSRFSNLQTFHVAGPAYPSSGNHRLLYEQGIVLSSLTERISLRRLRGTLLSYDRERIRYPLRLGYRMDESINALPGWTMHLNDGTAVVTQHRIIESDHYRAGKGHYVTRFDEGFTGSRTRLDNPSPSPYMLDRNWRSQDYLSYSDNFGSCYQAAIHATQGVVDAQVKGAGCPGDRNHVRWFARPDGSPVSLGWWH